jgi:serine/threonine-protein kinase
MELPEPLPHSRPEDLLGQTVGNFKIVRLLGKGGMGAVYLGEHTVIGSKVAMKFLHPEMAADPVLVQRFFAEARAVNLIGQENIVSILDLAMLPPNRYYLVMELLEGAPLNAMLGSPFPARVAGGILTQICDALFAAHQAGVVHRDLKPENVFLVHRENRDDFVKIVDFGIARLGTANTGVTAAGFVVGTPEYMAPEQWASSAVDGRADIYAIGLIGYAMVTGRLPFHADSPLAYYHAHCEQQPTPPRAINPDLPEAFEAAILKALAKRPTDRFQTAREMKAALLASLEPSRPAQPAQPSAPARQPTPSRVASPHSDVTLDAEANWDGAWHRGLRAIDLSCAGALLCSKQPFPPLLNRISVRLLCQDGGLETEAEVVRHVSEEQARGWGTSAGFAVQFLRPSPAFKAALSQLLQGRNPFDQSAQGPEPDDPAAEAILAGYEKRASGDGYALIGVSSDASCSELRVRCRQAMDELDSLLKRPLSFCQRAKATELSARLKATFEAFGTPARRAAHDAEKGNFRGIARCLSAGLTAAEAEVLRRDFLAPRPKNESLASLRLATARAFVSSGDHARALHEYEAALTLDPLNLEAQQQYWSLKRRVSA